MADKFKIYTVYKGDTPESIAKSQGISTEELLEYNNISDPTSLQVYQELKIPKEKNFGDLKINPLNWGIKDYSTKPFSQAFNTAKQEGSDRFYWNGGAYNTQDKVYSPYDPDKLVNSIYEDENDIKKGYDPKTNTWTFHKSVEGGSDSIGPGFKTLSKERKEYIKKHGNKVSDDVLRSWLKEDIYQHDQKLQQELGQTWNQLPPNIKMGLIDMRHNLGSLSNFPKLIKAIQNKDLKGIQEESKTTYVDKSGKRVFDERRWKRRVQKYFNSWETGGSINYISQFKSGGKLIDLINRTNSKNVDFINRLKDPNRKTITNWENPNQISTHKISYATDDEGNAIIYPQVQNVNGQLIDFTNPKYDKWDGYKNAINQGDTIQTTVKLAKKYSKNNKKFYPEFTKY